MWQISVHTLRGLEGFLHKELSHSLPREILFPHTTPGSVITACHSLLPLWRAKTSLLASSVRLRLCGPQLCKSVYDFRQILQSVDWSTIGFEKFRVHTRHSDLRHVRLLTEVLREEAGRVGKKTLLDFQGDVLHVEIVKDNVEVSLALWEDAAKTQFIPVHAFLVHVGSLEFSRNPEIYSGNLPATYLPGKYVFPKDEQEFFFRVSSAGGVRPVLKVVEKRSSEDRVIKEIVKEKGDVYVMTNTKSEFTARSKMNTWIPQFRWTDEQGTIKEIIKLLR